MLRDVFDEQGRYLGQTPVYDERPPRPEDVIPGLLRICAWCPDFDPLDPRNRLATHGLCEACEARVLAAVTAAA